MKFGYLNEGNPFYIRNNEAQEMVNCRIDRGFLEYGEFKVSSTEYEQTPGRKALLPNADTLVIEAPNYGAPGSLKLSKPAGLVRYGLPTAESYTGASQHNPVGIVDYSNVTGGTTTANGTYTYAITLDDTYTDTLMFRYATYNSGGKMDESKYVWYYDEANNKIIITLSFNPSEGADLNIVFHRHTDPRRIRNYKGKVFYAITYYEPTLGWESPPSFFDVELNPPVYEGVAYVKFDANLKVPSSITSEYPQTRLRVYRIPHGGDEYLLAYQVTSSFGGAIYDNVTDEELGTVLADGQYISAGLATDGNTDLPLDSSDVVSIALHKECLFVGLHNSKIVYYSKPVYRNEFPAENFFIFEHPIVGLTQKSGFLEVLTTKKVYTVYGDARGFRVEAVDYNAGLVARNTGQSVSGRMIALASESNSSNNRRDSVLMFDGLRAVDISTAIRNTLNTSTTGQTVDGSIVFTNRNLVKDNRFYVAEIREWKGDPLKLHTKNIVYDFIANGFSVANDTFKFGEKATEGFCYRTKEFVEPAPPSPKLTTYYKGIWLRVKGNYEIDFLGDGEIITTIEGECDKIELRNHNIAPTRFNSYSVRFRGDKDTRIYDWGLYK